MRDLALGAELAKANKDRADYLEMRAKAQAAVPEIRDGRAGAGDSRARRGGDAGEARIAGVSPLGRAGRLRSGLAFGRAHAKGPPITEADMAENLTYAAAGRRYRRRQRAWSSAIKPLVRATRRPGADAEIGGFGGLFDLRAAGFRDPVLVAANDGVGTKVKIAIESRHLRHDRHRPRRHVRQRHRRAGRGAAVLPRLFRHRAARSGAGRRRSSRASRRPASNPAAR